MLRKSRKNSEEGTTMTAPEIQREIVSGEELAARAGVRARARARAAGMKDMAAQMSGQMRRSETVRRRWPIAAAAVAAVLIGSVLVRRRKR